MWATLALTTALSLAPAQTGQVELKNVRATYGTLGQKREDTQLVPGDAFVVSYDIENLTVKEDGRVLYSMGMKLTKKGNTKPEFEQPAEEKEAVNTLGGSRLPSASYVVIGTDTMPGEYTMDVTVTDRATKKSASFSKAFEVVPTKLSIVRLNLTNENGRPAPPIGAPGQSLLLNFGLVGFDLDTKKMQPNLAVEMTVLDEAGKPVHAKPFTGTFTEVTDEYKKYLPNQFIINLNRSGKFKMVLKATDKLTSKSVEQSLELTVLEIK
jgi:hypothetical protein